MLTTSASFLQRALFALTLFTTAARAQVPAWPKVTPSDITSAGIGVQLTGADYGNGTFVLATYFGGTNAVPAITPAVFTSTDGTAWTRRNLTGASGRTGAPRFLNGKFLLGVTPDSTAGGNGVILSSTDGITWTASAILGATINAPGEFAFGNGLYAAPLASSAAQVATSTDGVTWTTRVIASGASSSHITFFNGKFYASCYGSATVTGLYSSADGVTWAKIPGAPANPGILAASSSTLLVTFSSGGTSGQSLSADGVTFTNASPGISLQTETVKFLNGAFVVTASTSSTNFDLTLARASLDGRTWASIGSTANQYYASEVAYGNGRYVFVGEFDIYSGSTTISAGGTAGGGDSGSNGGGTSSTGNAYLSNLSIRAFAGSGSQTLIVGLTIGGAGTSGTKNVLVRGAGPALAGFGLASALGDPKLTAYAGATAIATNDTWVSGEVGATAAAVGAFPFTAGSKDAAFLGSGITAGSYSVLLEGVNNTSGVALAEVYDATPGASFTTATPRFINVSSRTFVGTGDNTLICGFVVAGSGSRRLLIRAVGPGLAQFSLTGLLTDPQLALYNGSNTKIAENDDWDSAATLTAQQSVGAFNLPAASKDAVLVATVTPGSYTITITGANGGTGTALIELYELP